MRPQRDTFRRTYGLKEAKMAAAYVLALKIEKNSVDGKKLMDWKTPSDRNVRFVVLRNLYYLLTVRYSSLEPVISRQSPPLRSERDAELMASFLQFRRLPRYWFSIDRARKQGRRRTGQ